MYPSVNVWNFGGPQYEPPKSAPQDKLHRSTRILGGRDKKKVAQTSQRPFPKIEQLSCVIIVSANEKIQHGCLSQKDAPKSTKNLRQETHR